MGQEFLKKEHAIYFAAAIFCFEGLVAILSAVIFWGTKSQAFYMGFLGVNISVIWVVFMVYCPETPRFLYEKGQFLQLEAALLTVAKWNGKEVEAELRHEIMKLQNKAMHDSLY